MLYKKCDLYRASSQMFYVAAWKKKKVLSIKSQVSGLQTNITQLIFQTSFVLEEPKNYKGNLAEM